MLVVGKEIYNFGKGRLATCNGGANSYPTCTISVYVYFRNVLMIVGGG